MWAVGDRIPSERELALEFNVSRMTLRQAVQTLVEEGILERQVGAGTFVARKKCRKNDRRDEFYGVDGRTRQKPSSRTVSYLVTTPSLSEMERLKLKDDEKVLRMERIRYADEVPICFEVATLPIVSSRITSVIRLPLRFIERLKKADGKSVTRNKASLLRLHQKGLPSI